jgi:hypothetical protein
MLQRLDWFLVTRIKQLSVKHASIGGGGRTVMQEALFSQFRLERHVPGAHLPRPIDRFVDLSGVGTHLRPIYSDIGRPSIEPGADRNKKRSCVVLQPS